MIFEMNKSLVLFICIFLYLSTSSGKIGVSSSQSQNSYIEQTKEMNEKLKGDYYLRDNVKNNNPIFPYLLPKFTCDPDIKLNSVRQDVMTNKNFNK